MTAFRSAPEAWLLTAARARGSTPCWTRTIAALMPSEPEASGLLALLLFVESRRAARFDRVRGYVPLEEQDTRLWATDLIAEAEAVLHSAGTHAIGRFQIEAAILVGACIAPTRDRSGLARYRATLRCTCRTVARARRRDRSRRSSRACGGHDDGAATAS